MLGVPVREFVLRYVPAMLRISPVAGDMETEPVQFAVLGVHEYWPFDPYGVCRDGGPGRTRTRAIAHVLHRRHVTLGRLLHSGLPNRCGVYGRRAPTPTGNSISRTPVLAKQSVGCDG